MTNPKIEVDIAEILQKLDNKIDKLDDRLNKIEIGQAELKANQDNMKEQISEIKGTQKNQIWVLITTLTGAVLGILAVIAKVFFFVS